MRLCTRSYKYDTRICYNHELPDWNAGAGDIMRVNGISTIKLKEELVRFQEFDLSTLVSMHNFHVNTMKLHFHCITEKY